ncbi:MAG: hypothetical protein UEA60_07120, partial [Lachnospiraceae bacterium]|nr:hypothetical protein [Lachnospiraceae bacterium]
MRKETVNVFKGIAGVGAAIGGAAAFNETDVVYANEMVESDSVHEDLDLEKKASEIGSSIGSLSEAYEMASVTAEESLTSAKAQSESMSQVVESESASLSQQTSEANSTWTSTSAYLPESTSEAISELGIASEVASEATKNYDYYSNLVTEINAVRANLVGLKNEAKDNYLYFWSSTPSIKGVKYNGKDYYGHASDLARLLIKYKLYVTENVIIEDDNDNSLGVNEMALSFVDGGGANNYLKVNVNGTIRYYDYVNIATNGEPVFDENNPNNLKSICVLEKTLKTGSNSSFKSKGDEWFGEEKDITNDKGIVIQESYVTLINKKDNLYDSLSLSASEANSTYEAKSNSIVASSEAISESTLASSKASESAQKNRSESLENSTTASQAASTVASESGSESLSQYESISESLKLASTSVSTLISESVSIAKSESESASAVASASKSESESASAVASASKSESESASAVASASKSESESASAVASASKSESESASAVASASKSESESASAV